MPTEPTDDRAHRRAVHRFADDLAAPGAARAAVRSQLAAWGLGDVVEVALLLTSELVTNAVVHARSATTVTLDLDDVVVRISVHDGGSGPIRRCEPDPTTTTGRGLYLVDKLAARWGMTSGGAGQLVWFELPIGDGGSPARPR